MPPARLSFMTHVIAAAATTCSVLLRLHPRPPGPPRPPFRPLLPRSGFHHSSLLSNSSSPHLNTTPLLSTAATRPPPAARRPPPRTAAHGVRERCKRLRYCFPMSPMPSAHRSSTARPAPSHPLC
ncbi:hypothetical protein C8R44DRAFT_865003 [Mycena epipterygia]|nr:hypothetical protein C8R44DRAFT_865003 [Mycena epipterygia]